VAPGHVTGGQEFNQTHITSTSEGGLASGQQAIEKRYAAEFGARPSNASHKLLQVYAVGNDICAITEWSLTVYNGHSVRIYGRDADTWKIRMAYVN